MGKVLACPNGVLAPGVIFPCWAELDRLINLENVSFKGNEVLHEPSHTMHRSTSHVITVLTAICKDHGGACVS